MLSFRKAAQRRQNVATAARPWDKDPASASPVRGVRIFRRYAADLSVNVYHGRWPWLHSFAATRLGLAIIAMVVLLSVAAQADVPSWLQWLPASSPASGILYRSVPSLAGTTSIKRPPRETAPLLATQPAVAAREYEARLDFVNAEARWVEVGGIELADYYHRRMEPQKELQALAAAEARLPAVDAPVQPETMQRAWQLHERIQRLIAAEAMPATVASQYYEIWLRKYPRSDSLHRRYFDFLVENALLPRADEVLKQYQGAFPNDRVFPIHARTSLAEKRGSPGGAIAVFDAAFDPLWPQELLNRYFKLLTDSHRVYEFYQNASRAAAARPLDVAPAARLFHFHKSENEIGAARRVLAEFRVRKEAAQTPWAAAELNTLARLSNSVSDHEETIRYAYALYSLPGADPASVEAALVQIAATLLAAPDEPIRFGRGDLSFYRDIATIDSSPGFLNGILSLLFNSQYPDGQFRTQERKSEAYFHRAKAAELYKLLSDRFPRSSERPRLLAQLIESYGQYGEDEAIIRQGTAFLADFPDAGQRTRVALQIADARARRKEVTEELAVYDQLLRELAARAQQVPLGSGQRPRSPDYVQVLQRYISRLSQLNRIPDALALYRREIDRNPNDPGLYDRLADFLGANQRAAEVEEIYKRAIQQFQEPSWTHKLARYYLRNRRANDLARISRQAVDTFSGSELDAYVSDVVADSAFERRLQVEINLYAHARFPHDSKFVHNLISLYSTGPTSDAVALSRLLADHWFEDETIRRMYFERLAAGGALPDLVQRAANLLPAASRGTWSDAAAANPALVRFIAEAEAWQSHFETASTIMRALADAYPADVTFAGRAADLYRSLGAYDAFNTTVAVSIAENLARSEPRDRARLTRIGEIYADREMMREAGAVWRRIPEIDRGGPEGYLETATLFWDYLMPDEALTWLRRGRVQLKDPTRWAYEMGAIYESQGRRDDVVSEYLNGALSTQSGPSQARLLRLATRQDYRTQIDEETRRRVTASPEDPNVLRLRVNVLREQQRHPEVESLFTTVVDRTRSREILSYIRGVAAETALRSVQERALRREAELESDPQQKLRYRLELAHFLEAAGDLRAAEAEFDSIYQANSLVGGVIRAAADYYWRHDKAKSVQILRAAADRSHASLKPDYLSETVRKANEAGRYPDAIRAAQDLLQIDPIKGEFIALMAEAMAAAGRESELQQLYTSKIAEIQQSQIAQAEKTDRIAAMRRGLVPVLKRQGKFREALDQYIEIINRFPDDQQLLSEAGQLASQQNLRPQLTGYYTKTIETSPRDPRWSIVLARLQTQFENHPAAIDAYTQAMTARPERKDLAIARADLEERTFRFADAIATYNRLAELERRNPFWLERVAVQQIRLGRAQDAITTLRRAYIDNRPEASRDYGRVALVLEEHGMADQAAGFIQQQFDAISSDASGRTQWSRHYARIMTRARRSADALQPLLSFQDTTAARAMGQAVAQYFTPEEKQTFASLLSQRRQNAAREQYPVFVDIASSARLYDLEVTWRLEEAAQSQDASAVGYRGAPVNGLQERRMRFGELARQLEDLGAKSAGDRRYNLLSSALETYRTSGDTASELRLLDTYVEVRVNHPQRYFELLARSRPDDLLTFASRADSQGLLAAQALIAAGDQARALQAIQRQNRSPVWVDAYTSLTGLYFGLNSPAVQAAFQRALGPQVIQDRIAKPVDRTRELAGDVWYYYGQRYGQYLRDIGQPQTASDYLMSEAESRPGDPNAYLEMARYYKESGDTQRALVEYRHALELNANRSDIHSSIATLLWDAGRQTEALAEWRTALDKAAKLPNAERGSVIIRDIRSKGQTEALRKEIEGMMRAIAAAVQPWQLPMIIQAAFENSTEDQWMIAIVRTSKSPAQVLEILDDQQWLVPRQRKIVLQTALSTLSASLTEANRYQYQQTKEKYLDILLEDKDIAPARQLLGSFTDLERRGYIGQQAELRIAAAENRIEALLESYRQNPLATPEDWILQQTAVTLNRSGMPNAGRLVLEFLYTLQIERPGPNSAAFLGLAEIHLRQQRVSDAVDLLKRLNTLSTAPFEHLVPSARVLATAGRSAEATEFLKLRLQSVPWDDEARLEMAKITGDPADFQRVVMSRQATYDVRAQAAREQLKRPVSGSTGTRELDLLSGRIPLTPDSADAPYFFHARIAAAEQAAPAVRYRMLIGAIAERPDDPTLRRNLFLAALEAREYRMALAVYQRRGPANDSTVTAGMAEARLQLGEFAEAAGSFRFAASQETDASRKRVLEDRARQAEAANEKMVENERRRPVIRAELDQPNAVQRRLP